VPELDGRLEALNKSLDALGQRYTDAHPDVIAVKRQIKELEDQKVEVLAARRKAAQASPEGRKTGSSLQGNPVYQQLRVTLAETEAAVAQLRTRVAEYEGRLAKLRDSAKLAPQLEAEYTQLNRDYGVHKRNYESLVSRREQAEISGDMENVSGADFRLIDPPRVSPQPVEPNRTLFLLAALFAAIGAGLFASFAASQIRPTYFDVRALREITQLPVLGSVTMLVGEAQKRRERRRLIGFVAGVLAFLGTYGAGLLALVLLSTRAAA